MYAAYTLCQITQANPFADNDFTEFLRPDHYIRYIGEHVHV
jgi:hypothetical protein